MKKDIINILDIVVVILFIFSVVIFIWWLFGRSPTDIQAILAFVSFIGGLSVRNTFAISNLNREVGEIKIGIKHGFERVREDIKRIDDKLDVLVNRK